MYKTFVLKILTASFMHKRKIFYFIRKHRLIQIFFILIDIIIYFSIAILLDPQSVVSMKYSLNVCTFVPSFTSKLLV